MFDKITQFLEQSRAEFRHVNWPTRREAVRLTGIIIVISVILAAFLGAFDYLFTSGIAYLAQAILSR